LVGLILFSELSHINLHPHMKICFKTLKKETFELDIDLQDQISQIKEQIFRLKGISVEKQKLLFAGDILEDNKTIGDYQIQKCTTVYLVY
jgi:hypothetical protein